MDIDNNAFFCLVVGSRTFNDYELLKKSLDEILKDKEDMGIVLVSGGAKGADSLAERYALERNYDMIVMRANWTVYGKSAGYIRNTQMHEYISAKPNRMVVAFWDGQSKGTEHSFKLAERFKNPITTIRF